MPGPTIATSLTLSKAVTEAKRYDTQKTLAGDSRALMKLRLNVAAPAPDDARKRARLTSSRRSSKPIRRGQVLSDRPASLRTSTSFRKFSPEAAITDELTEAWKGWHGVGSGMREGLTPQFVLSRTRGRASSGSRTWASCGARLRHVAEEFDTES